MDKTDYYKVFQNECRTRGIDLDTVLARVGINDKLEKVPTLEQIKAINEGMEALQAEKTVTEPKPIPANRYWGIIENACHARNLNMDEVLSKASIPYAAMHTPSISQLVTIADAIGCSMDELTGRTETPNLKRPIGEELTAIGFKASVLKQMARDMLESRIEHAVQDIIKDPVRLEQKVLDQVTQAIYTEVHNTVTAKLARMHFDIDVTIDGKEEEK